MTATLDQPKLDTILGWHSRAESYDRLTRDQPLFSTLAERLVSYLPFSFQGDLIDLGAGAGLLSRLVLNRFPKTRILAVEPAQGMAELAQRNLGDSVKGYVFRPAEYIHLENAKSDAVLCNAAFHLMNDKAVFSSVSRVLYPNGILAFNLWWHSFEETTGFDSRPCWTKPVEKVLNEMGFPAPDWPSPTIHRVRTKSGLETDARQFGLILEDWSIDTDWVRADFFLQFAAMSPNWIPSASPEVSDRVFKRASAMSFETVPVQTARFCFRKR